MKKLNAKIRFIGAFLAFAVMCMPTMKVQAEESATETAKTYTVTFRPGDVGYFALSANAAGSKQENALAVAKQTYGGYADYTYEATKHGAIKVTVPAGAAMPQTPGYIVAEAGYFVKETSIWGPTTQTVDKNVDFVVDYGKLVNGVEYTVEYVDRSSGESIAPVYIAQANIGETRVVTAPSRIVISEGTVYNLSSEATLEMVLNADAAKNVFTFSYTMAPRGTVENEIVTYVEGETATTVIDNGTTVITQGQNGDAEGEGGNAEGESGNTETGNTEAGNTEAENGTENGAESTEDNITIEDENSPLNAGELEDENAGNVINIGEGDTPLAGFGEKQGANTAKIWAIMFALAAAGTTAIWLIVRKKRDAEEEEKGNQTK